MATWNADCNADSINTAIGNASAGDTIAVASGTMSSGTVTINKAVYVIGNGTLPSKGSTGNSIVSGGLFYIYTNDSRLGNFKYTSGEIEVSGCTRCLIDHLTLDSSSSSIEFITVFGPDNAWTTDHTMGSGENVFVEDCILGANNGSAQCVQINYNGRVVFRYNSIDRMKFDVHGLWSNGYASDPEKRCNWDYPQNHSGRHCEVYENVFTNSYMCSMDIRGGTGVIYNNTMTAATGGDCILFREYCISVGDDGNCSRCMCVADYPLRDQIGRGKNQALEPMYLWGNTGNGHAIQGYVSDGPPSYTILSESMPSATCMVACGVEHPNPGYDDMPGGETWADFSDIIKENRDYYISQKSGYSAYTYPHPLRGEGGTQRTITGRLGGGTGP